MAGLIHKVDIYSISKVASFCTAVLLMHNINNNFTTLPVMWYVGMVLHYTDYSN